MKHALLLLFAVVTATAALAQSASVRGTVRADEPASYATVMLKNNMFNAYQSDFDT